MSRFCTGCGSAVAAGARFCRACGTPVTSGAPEPEPEPEAETTTVAAAADVPLAWSDEAPRRSGGRGPFVAILAVVMVTMSAGGGVGAYLLLRDDSSSADADWSEVLSPIDDGVYSDGGSEGSTEEETPLAAEIDAGLYVQLGSFLGDGATREADRLREHGMDAFVIDSNGVAELLPAFKVVVAGPLESTRDQRRVLRAGRAAGVDGIPKTLTPAAESASPAGVGSGSFGGTLTKAGREVEVGMDFSTDGRSATIGYARPSCAGELRLVDAAGAVLTYAERITSGPCQGDGAWSVKPAGDEIQVTWRDAVDDDFGVGVLAGGSSSLP